jgi:hypothetical protein
MKTLKFDVSRPDQLWIESIVKRAEIIAKSRNQKLDPFRLMMDITAVHCNGNPLRLKELAEWKNDFEFIHDVWGIMRHVNRQTGMLEDCFSPRFTDTEAQRQFHANQLKAS